MANSKIVTKDEFRRMKKTRPFTYNQNDRQQIMKQRLLQPMINADRDRWERRKKESRMVFEWYAWSAADKGFTFTSDATVASIQNVSPRTVRSIRRMLIDQGKIVVVYLRAKGRNNAKGTPICLFKDHPYFHYWVEFLNLDIEFREGEKENVYNLHTSVHKTYTND